MIKLSAAQAGSIGVIGGADGPTAIFVTSNPWPLILVAGLAVGAILALLAWLFLKRK